MIDLPDIPEGWCIHLHSSHYYKFKIIVAITYHICSILDIVTLTFSNKSTLQITKNN